MFTSLKTEYGSFIQYLKIVGISLIIVILVSILYINFLFNPHLVEPFNAVLTFFLVTATIFYVSEAQRLANISQKQTNFLYKQEKLKDLNKLLEKIYIPIQQTLINLKGNINAPGLKEEGEYKLNKKLYFSVQNIFTKYSHLIDAKINQEWMFRTSDKSLKYFHSGDKDILRRFDFKKMETLVEKQIKQLKKEISVIKE